MIISSNKCFNILLKFILNFETFRAQIHIYRCKKFRFYHRLLIHLLYIFSEESIQAINLG